MAGKLAVFNLPDDTRESDIEDLFGKYGKLNRIALRNGRQAMMCFLEYDDSRDAEEALERRHEYSFRGNRIRVEFSGSGYSKPDKGRGRGADSRRRGGDSRGRGRGGRDSRRRGRDSRSRPRKGKGKGSKEYSINPMWHKVVVTGMPKASSWQDMKDFFRPAGNVKYTDSKGDGTGVAGFATREEAEQVCDKLDGETFRARDGDTGTVKVVYEPKDDDGGRGRGDDDGGRGRGKASRSRSGGRGGGDRSGGDRDRSRGRDRSEKRSNKRSERSDRSRSRS